MIHYYLNLGNTTQKMSTPLTQYYWQYGIVSGASALNVYNVKVFKFPP